MTAQVRRQVFFHIGAPKSGTTYLQHILWDNRAALARAGVLYPGDDWASHVWAALDLRNVLFRGHENPRVKGSWTQLVDEIRAWDGPVAVIDHELFSVAGPRAIDRAMNALDFADVHLVYTLRDMSRVLPGAWQEWVKNCEQDTFAEFLAAIRETPPRRAKTPSGADRTAEEFWGLHDTPAILTRWTRALPPDHVHVITVPPPGTHPSILWGRFARLLGLEPGSYDIAGRGANSSLAAAEAAVLRQFNVAIGGEEFPWGVYDAVIKHYLAPKLAERDGFAIELPEPDYDWAVEWSRHTTQLISDSGFHVVGDMAEVLPTVRPTGCDPDDAPADARASAAIAALAVLAWTVADSEADDRTVLLTQVQKRLRRADAIVLEHRELPPLERIKRCGVELAEQIGWLDVAYRGYRKLRRRRN